MLTALFALSAATWLPLRLSADQQAPPDRIQGLAFAGAVNLVKRDAHVVTELFVPHSLKVLRCVVVVMNHGVMSEDLFYSDVVRRLSADAGCATGYAKVLPMSGPQPNRSFEAEVLRNAGTGSGEAMVRVMDLLARETGHPELRSAPMLLWGFSQGASFAMTFAQLYPERTIGFVRYHIHRRNVPPTIKGLDRIPALIVAGAQDQAAGFEDAEQLWREGRTAGAPWTLAVEPLAQHSSPAIHQVTLRELTVPWMKAILRLRLGPRGLQTIPNTAGVLVDLISLKTVPATAIGAESPTTNWLPDEATLSGWKAVVRTAGP
jgi:pimeloyl-ACP methyl ester carboxylesterase